MYIQPRQSGKTTAAIYEFLKDSVRTLYVNPNQVSVDYVLGIVGQSYFRNVVISKNLKHHIIGRRY